MEYHPDVKTYGLRPVYSLASACFFCSLAAAMLSLRVYSRIRLTEAFGKDDWLLLLTFAVYVANCGVFIKTAVLETVEGVVGPAATLSELTIVFFSLYIVTQILMKFSICTFFLRIIQERWQRLAILTAVTLYTIYALFFLFFGLFHCGSRTSTTCEGSQYAMMTLSYTHAVLNAVMDWIFVVVPIFIVVKTSMPIRTKLSVCFIILLAAWGSIVSVARIPFVGEINATGPWFYAREVPIAVLSIVESGLGIVCLSAAALKPMAKEIAKKVATIFSLSQGSEGSSTHEFGNIGRAENGDAGGEQMQQRSAVTIGAFGGSSPTASRVERSTRVDSAGKERSKEIQEICTVVVHAAV